MPIHAEAWVLCACFIARPRGHDTGRRLGSRAASSHLCPPLPCTPKRLCKAVPGAASGGLGRWVPLAFRRLVLLWPELWRSRPPHHPALRPVAIEGLEVAPEGQGSGSLSSRCAGVQDTTAQHRSCKLRTWERKGKPGSLAVSCVGQPQAGCLSTLLSGTLGQDVKAQSPTLPTGGN